MLERKNKHSSHISRPTYNKMSKTAMSDFSTSRLKPKRSNQQELNLMMKSKKDGSSRLCKMYINNP